MIILAVTFCSSFCFSFFRESGGIIIDTRMDEGQNCYKTITPLAIYYYQSESGGFSSILDKEGIDWVGFRDVNATDPLFPDCTVDAARGSNMVFFAVQIIPDELVDYYSVLKNNQSKGVESADGMVVFGFGRNHDNMFLSG